MSTPVFLTIVIAWIAVSVVAAVLAVGFAVRSRRPAPVRLPLAGLLLLAALLADPLANVWLADRIQTHRTEALRDFTGRSSAELRTAYGEPDRVVPPAPGDGCGPTLRYDLAPWFALLRYQAVVSTGPEADVLAVVVDS